MSHHIFGAQPVPPPPRTCPECGAVVNKECLLRCRACIKAQELERIDWDIMVVKNRLANLKQLRAKREAEL